MSAPSKVQINQLVRIQPKESVANTLEVNLTFMDHIYGGDEINEAEGINESGRNESERFRPRNIQRGKGRRSSF